MCDKVWKEELRRGVYTARNVDIDSTAGREGGSGRLHGTGQVSCDEKDFCAVLCCCAAPSLEFC